jgi:hypothetical protein
MTSSPTKISWVNISYDFGNVSIHVDPDRPCRVEAILDDENQRLKIWLHELPKKRCGNCKLSHEGVCENCAGDNFGSSTEIVSWAEGCENWEKVKQEV